MRGIIYLIKNKHQSYNLPIYIGSIDCDENSNSIDKIIRYHRNDYGNNEIFQILKNEKSEDLEIIEIGVVEYKCKHELKNEENMWRTSLILN